jgi:hypothetical protein
VDEMLISGEKTSVTRETKTVHPTYGEIHARPYGSPYINIVDCTCGYSARTHGLVSTPCRSGRNMKHFLLVPSGDGNQHYCLLSTDM